MITITFMMLFLTVTFFWPVTTGGRLFATFFWFFRTSLVRTVSTTASTFTLFWTIPMTTWPWFFMMSFYSFLLFSIFRTITATATFTTKIITIFWTIAWSFAVFFMLFHFFFLGTISGITFTSTSRLFFQIFWAFFRRFSKFFSFSWPTLGFFMFTMLSLD